MAFVVLAALFIVGSLPAQTVLAESQAYRKADEYAITHFQNVIMKDEEFLGMFGDIAWDDIAQEVKDSVDIVRYRKEESASYGDKSYVFIGMIYDISIELVIDKVTGELQKIEYVI